MTVLVFGGNGQVGQELRRALGALGPVVATTRTGRLADGSTCARADFAQQQDLVALLEHLRPAWVVNAAAYTAVDRAEQEPEAAFLANAEAPGVIAHWCAAHGVPLVHYSTDYVFDGEGGRPYLEDAPTRPLSVYGASKLAGERAIREAGGRHLIFRTAWVHAAHGNNFLRTMLRVGANGGQLRVVADQVGTPTAAALIADLTAQVIGSDDGQRTGVWHMTAAGETTWHGFAEEIFRQAAAMGLIQQAPSVAAIATADYPALARRPMYSCLDTSKLRRDFGIRPPSWQEGARHVLSELSAVHRADCR
ncbi:dTDP-4-dehydrorhamnose reductase [Xanthomonas hyacinthi]|uniref:dTDP-4-dehydrorhamnose reductase n=1 Tax=Xanthomonas hyacinthi TaxID=56455 RepID=A0A2S7F3P7_9XANT|nr:dTDP-4-dehydrorhamnose reductase [Xanthomonas hyacinthi]KLD75821.1 dTDP-4-dehydrorhamnose reductase [Xanthomonas hyacinthi DSM 19077]PPU99973.1 dTDP-4-dehydrorhamnose reductase [Xanthomonas hyacinthi]QGY76150.1 dTDP-4-dehydrorhamnose reductase [Xanthomonas hyacinthi]